MFNVIGDVAGRFNELMLLIDKMPKDSEIILVGDLNDRGPDSNKVIQWAIDNKIRCTKSNHGDMFIDYYNQHRKTKYPAYRYSRYDFISNGGRYTVNSYPQQDIRAVPEEHIKWLAELPWYIETDELFISHAPWHPELDLDQVTTIKDLDNSLLWNRAKPKQRDKFQIHGHNSFFRWYPGGAVPFGVCIDDCAHNQLMGIHWPSQELFTQPYLEP